MGTLRRSFLGVLAVGVLSVLPPEALAHRSQSVLTTLDWSPEHRTLQVVHRIHAQDAEIALAKVSGQPTVDLTQIRDQARLLVYVEANFTVFSKDKVLTLEPVGVEMVGEDALVYREGKLPAPLDLIEVDDQLLRDVFDQQTNLVNVRMTEGRVRTLIFAGRDRRKQARGLL